jgi:hypothetical protein
MAPTYTKTIICLANSRKITGRCVAGKEIAGSKMGGWIRPISGRPAGELSEEERRFQTGHDPKLLDVITIPFIEHRPHSYQTENHVIDDGYYWAKEREASWDELRGALDSIPGSLWNNSSSSYNGLHDRIEESVANGLDNSLRLIEVTDLKMVVAVEGAEFGAGKRRVRGHFTLNGSEYWLSVTVPVTERKYLAGANGEFQVGRAILCVSLGEPYGGYAYKLIAGVFPKP